MTDPLNHQSWKLHFQAMCTLQKISETTRESILMSVQRPETTMTESRMGVVWESFVRYLHLSVWRCSLTLAWLFWACPHASVHYIYMCVCVLWIVRTNYSSRLVHVCYELERAKEKAKIGDRVSWAHPSDKFAPSTALIVSIDFIWKSQGGGKEYFCNPKHCQFQGKKTRLLLPDANDFAFLSFSMTSSFNFQD